MNSAKRSFTDRLWYKCLLGILFWTAVGFFFSTQTVIRLGSGEGNWLVAVKNTMPHWYIWGTVSMLIAWSDRWASGVSTLVKVRVALHVPLALVWCSAVIFLGLAVNSALGFETPQFSLSWLGTQYHWNVLVYTVIVGVLVAYDYHRRATEQTLQTSELEARLAHARLETLKAQLHPHFLFNTLNAISAFIERDPRTARQMMAHLGDLLRYSLDHRDAQEVTLAEEMDLVQQYMAIQKIRFEGRLEFNTTIDEEALPGSVPNLLLQPLLENAVKHGVTKRNATGRIQINGRRINDKLCLEVTDNGAGLSDNYSSADWGLGLANTAERLTKLYGTDGTLDILENTDGGVTAKICVPWRIDGPGPRDNS